MAKAEKGKRRAIDRSAFPGKSGDELFAAATW